MIGCGNIQFKIVQMGSFSSSFFPTKATSIFYWVLTPMLIEWYDQFVYLFEINSKSAGSLFEKGISIRELSLLTAIFS